LQWTGTGEVATESQSDIVASFHFAMNLKFENKRQLILVRDPVISIALRGFLKEPHKKITGYTGRALHSLFHL